MRISQAAARIYATSLFDIGVDDDSLERIGEELHAVRDAFGGLELELQTFFELPQLPREGKKQVLDEAFGGKLSRPVMGLLHVLVDKRRELLLSAIIDEFDELRDVHEGRVQALVVAARPLDAELAEALRLALENRTGQQVVLHQRVDPKVIGGLRVSLGDLVVDGTLRKALSDMRQTLTSSLA